MTQPDGGVLTQWDERSNGARLVHAQQVNGAITVTQTQTYQNGLLMSEMQSGMTQAVTYDYNGFGQVTSVVHPQSGTISRTYDTAGRLRTQTQSGGTESYTYNALGQVSTVTHADNTTTSYTYDAQGRQLTQGGSASYPLRYDYDTLAACGSCTPTAMPLLISRRLVM